MIYAVYLYVDYIGIKVCISSKTFTLLVDQRRVSWFTHIYFHLYFIVN